MVYIFQLIFKFSLFLSFLSLATNALEIDGNLSQITTTELLLHIETPKALLNGIRNKLNFLKHLKSFSDFNVVSFLQQG